MCSLCDCVRGVMWQCTAGSGYVHVWSSRPRPRLCAVLLRHTRAESSAVPCEAEGAREPRRAGGNDNFHCKRDAARDVGRAGSGEHLIICAGGLGHGPAPACRAVQQWPVAVPECAVRLRAAAGAGAGP